MNTRLLSALLLLTLACTLLAQSNNSDQSVRAIVTGKDMTVQITKTVDMKFVWVPSGAFKMGSEKCFGERPPHRVTISEGFWIGKFEVTRGQYAALAGANAVSTNAVNWPADNVSWNDAMKYIGTLNTKCDIDGEFRLPSEAEWEYAAGHNCPSGWPLGKSCGHTHEVGKANANARGIHDMLGNVQEWCSDWYEREYYAKSSDDDPNGPEKGEYKVLRGGSWGDRVSESTITLRNRAFPELHGGTTGFRIVLSPNPAKDGE